MKRIAVLTSVAVMVALCASLAAAQSNYYMQADAVRGAEGTPQGAVCVPNSVFLPGESIVWRAKIFDSHTGEVLTGGQIKELGITMQVSVSNGQTVDLHYGSHPPDPKAPKHGMYWSGHWVVPADAPTGTLTYTLTAKDAQGNTTTFEPIGQNVGIPPLTIASK